MMETDHPPTRALCPRRQMKRERVARTHDVTVVISDLGGGGAQRVLKNIVDMWTESGLRVCVITFADERLDRYSLPKVTRLSLGRSERRSGPMRSALSKSRRAMPQWIKQHTPWRSVIGKIVHGIGDVCELRKSLRIANSPVVLAMLTTVNVKTIMATVGSDIRVVISERIDVTKQPPNWPWNVLRHWLYRYADAITANSHGALESMKSYVPRPKLFFVPNPISFPAAPSDPMRREKVILNVGRLTHQKAQDILLKAYARVVAKIPEWKLVIIGCGAEKQKLYGQAAALRLPDNMEWIDWTSEIEMYYERAGMFVLPSRFEGTPNVLLEAMSFGLPSIVTDASPGPLEHIVDGENGLVVPVENERRLASAILRLARSEDLRGRLGKSARETINNVDHVAVQDTWLTVLGLSDHIAKKVDKRSYGL